MTTIPCTCDRFRSQWGGHRQDCAIIKAQQKNNAEASRRLGEMFPGPPAVVGIECPDCGGTGRSHTSRQNCWTCDGAGVLAPKKSEGEN